MMRIIVVMIGWMTTSVVTILKSFSMIFLSQVNIIILFLMVYICYHVIIMIHMSSLSLLIYNQQQTQEILVELQEKVKYGFKFSGCNILNNVGYLMTSNQYDIKVSRYVNQHVFCCEMLVYHFIIFWSNVVSLFILEIYKWQVLNYWRNPVFIV